MGVGEPDEIVAYLSCRGFGERGVEGDNLSRIGDFGGFDVGKFDVVDNVRLVVGVVGDDGLVFYIGEESRSEGVLVFGVRKDVVVVADVELEGGGHGFGIVHQGVWVVDRRARGSDGRRGRAGGQSRREEAQGQKLNGLNWLGWLISHGVHSLEEQAIALGFCAFQTYYHAKSRRPGVVDGTCVEL